MNKLSEYLYALPFWNNLTETEQGLLRDNAYIRFFDKNAPILHSEASDDIGFMMIVDGRIRAFLQSLDGREITLFSLGAQDVCVFSALSLFKQISFQVFLTADRLSKVLIINMSIVERLMKSNIYFRCFSYELIAERFSSVIDSVKWILFHGLEQRLAAFLVAEYDRHNEMNIRLTHDYIARHVGTSRERVTKTLKKLSDKELIRKAKRCVEITDIEKLREIARSPEFAGRDNDFKTERPETIRLDF